MIHNQLIVKDNLPSAIDYLISFSKSYCIDINMTKELGYIYYRCDHCQFNLEGICMVRTFVYEHGTQKNIGDLNNNLIPNFKPEGEVKSYEQ